MHEPLAPLTRPDPSPASPSLSASEVRRRGDRLRRRRRAGSALAAATAVAAVAGAATLLSGGLGETTAPAPVDAPSGTAEPSPSPTEPATERPSPAPGFLATIPASFPLGLGLPEPGGDVGERVSDDSIEQPWWFDPCHEGVSPSDGPLLDLRSVTQTAPVTGWGRQLVLFPDDDAASAALSELVAAMGRCPTYLYEDGMSEEVLAEVGPPLRVGDESFAVVSHSRSDGRPTTLASLYGVVRVGNAVLVTALHGEFGAAMPEDLEAIVADELEPTVRLAREMCVFAGDDAGRRSPCDS